MVLFFLVLWVEFLVEISVAISYALTDIDTTYKLIMYLSNSSSKVEISTLQVQYYIFHFLSFFLLSICFVDFIDFLCILCFC